MACSITLSMLPTTLDCLSWSKDNLIAVAGGEQVAILTPRLKESGPNGTHWDSTLFKANAFTADEIPRSDPLSSENFSVGEELSLRHVQALEWSSPGFGKYGRCVLAVLSSNHALSIWDCDGKPDVSASWRRVVVANHAIREYYRRMNDDIDQTEQEQRERLQVAQRIRAFAWSAPLCEHLGHDGDLAQCPDFGHQILAVSTERGDVLLLHLRSPHNIINSTGPEWRIEIMHCCKLGISAEQTLQLDPSNNDDDKARSDNDSAFIADHIAWDAWTHSKERSYCATLAVVGNVKLLCLRVERDIYSELPYAGVAIDTKTEHLLRLQTDITGPLKFAPNTSLLTAFAEDRIICIDTSTEPLRDSDCTFHHLDGRWDEISGVAFSDNTPALPLTHVTSHLSSSTAHTAVLSLPFNNEEAVTTPSWQTTINKSKATFSAQNNLDGCMQERTWGIAASPLGEYIATATTMVPSDSVAYTVPSDHRTIINITLERTNAVDNILPVDGGTAGKYDVTVEALLFSLQRYSDRHPEVFDSETLVQAILKTLSAPAEHSDIETIGGPPASASGTMHLARHLKTQLFEQPEMKNERVQLLANIALGKMSTSGRVSKSVIQGLVTQVIKFLEHAEPGGPLSNKIRTTYATLRSKLQLEVLPVDVDSDVNTLDEVCRICQESILFESVEWAKCGSGHQFSRCALTFLAIQEPDISKHCGICGKQYLNEWKLPELVGFKEDDDVETRDHPIENTQAQSDDAGSQLQNGTVAEAQAIGVQENSGSHIVRALSTKNDSVEPLSSLARILFAAFDVCIYCGGKFVA